MTARKSNESDGHVPDHIKDLRAHFKLKSIRFIPKSEIRQRPRSTPIKKLPFWEELEKVFIWAKEHGVTPFEEAMVIDIPEQKGMAPADVKKEIDKYKNLKLTVALAVRQQMKDHGLTGAFHMLIRDDGNKIYLVAD